MNILIISYYFPPLNSIASLRPYSWAKYWSLNGHTVTVLTQKKRKLTSNMNLDLSNFQMIEIDDIIQNIVDKDNLNKKNNYKSKIKEDIKSFLSKKGVFQTARMPDLSDFNIIKSYKKIKNKKYDMIISTSGPYSNHLIAYLYKRIHNDVYWIADYRDLWTSNHIYKGLFPFYFIEKYLESKINTKANLITTVSEPLAKTLKNKYLLDNVQVISNGIDLEDFENLPKENYWKDKKTRLVYTGSVYLNKQKPDILFTAIAKLKDTYKSLYEKFEVVFIGGRIEGIKEKIDYYGISDIVRIQGFLPREDALRMQRDANGLIFLNFNDGESEGIVTGKIFEYIASATIILGIDTSNRDTVGHLIDSFNAGYNFDGNTDLIFQYIEKLINEKPKSKLNVSEDFKNLYSRKNLAEKLLEHVRVSLDTN